MSNENGNGKALEAGLSFLAALFGEDEPKEGRPRRPNQAGGRRAGGCNCTGKRTLPPVQPKK
jgi:hypothetical protein